MPLFIPETASTFADSTITHGDPLSRKYVLAQFRSDAGFDWVRDARGRLVRDELKFRDLKEGEARLKQDRALWSRIQAGIGQASIIVIDSNRIRADVVAREMANGAELQDLENNLHGLVDQCATAVIAGTPIAYLPHNLARAIPWRSLSLVADLDAFTPEKIQQSIGSGLKTAMIFAARAHAVFDLATTRSNATRTDDTFSSPLSRVMLAELLSTPRAFDSEAPGTLPLLNEAADTIAKAASTYLPPHLAASQQSLVREIDSKTSDEMQAADVAAGWARELLDRGGERSLGATFARVWLNGQRLT